VSEQTNVSQTEQLIETGARRFATLSGNQTAGLPTLPGASSVPIADIEPSKTYVSDAARLCENTLNFASYLL
jgi:hypothetical protein